MLCSKGRALHHSANDTSDRLSFPTLRERRSLPLERCSWDEAIAKTAKAFKQAIAKHGPDSVGLYVSGQCLTEEYYLANKLTKGFIGTNNIDTNSRLCMSSAVVAYKMSVGEDAPPISYDDIEAGDCYLVSGANPAVCHPVLFRRMEAQIEAGQAKMIVIDPRRTASAQMAEVHLAPLPGTDVALHNAIALGLLQKECLDVSFLESHTDGWYDLKDHLEALDFSELCQTCGIANSQVQSAVDLIAASKGLLTMWAMGLNQSAVGVDKNLSLINLNLITGRIGRPGSGPFSLTGQPNAMGGREVGGLSSMLAAHRDLGNAKHRKEVAEHWDVPVDRLNAKPGLSAMQMLEAMESGRLKALWVICTNPLVSWPDLERVEKAFSRLPFLAVSEISDRSDTLAHADVVFPAAGWAEKEGTMTNSERRITHLPQLIDPPGEARPDTEILIDVAKALGHEEAFQYKNTEAIFNEHRELTRNTNIDITGISYERLREGSIQWPCPSSDHPGTPRLFGDAKFWTDNGKAKIYAVPVRHRSENTDPDYPFVLTTGRLRDQWHTMTRTGKVRRLMRQDPTPRCEMNPEDGEHLDIHDDEVVEVIGRRGRCKLKVAFTNDIRPGVVFLPMHWGKTVTGGSHNRANNLTATTTDPLSGEPDLKYSAVRVEVVRPAKQRTVIIGSGAAALELVQQLRGMDCPDALTIVGEEKHGFYNRILLPDLISKDKAWSELAISTQDLFDQLKVEHLSGDRVNAIHRKEKFIELHSGTKVFYDRLVVATGSRAPLPELPGVDLKGVFTLRHREQAEAILDRCTPNAHFIVVGGGLLGLELADALRKVGTKVTLIQRSGRLMRGQLDERASELLLKRVQDRGIEVKLNQAIASIQGKDGEVNSVTLKDGEVLPATGLCFAMGIVPNAELGRDSQLDTDRGIVVDDRLCTSDPNIFAIGEVAQHRDRCVGTTPACQHQAQDLAGVLTGDPQAQHTGSLSMNILKLEGLQLASIGTIAPSEEGIQRIAFEDEGLGVYKVAYLNNNRMIGAQFVGNMDEFGTFKSWISEGLELESERQTIFSGTGASPQEKMIGRPICSCHGVGEGNLEQCIAKGAQSLDELCEKTKAGTGCGSCRPQVKTIWEAKGAKEAQA